MKTALSIAIIASNEADRIVACVHNLDFAAEVLVVVDERSDDDTLSIARAHGCRTLINTWRGYAQQKQFAVDQCRNRWVLVLDADERVPDPSVEAIRRQMASLEPDVAAYSLLRKNFFKGGWVTRCGLWPDRVIRLVDKTRGSFSDHLVHEQWVANGRVKPLNIAIEHHSFRSYADMLDKLQNYSTLAALQMHNEGNRAHWWTPITHGMWMFVHCYLIRLGILAGFDGFMISMLNAGGSFMKYAKLRELKWGER